MTGLKEQFENDPRGYAKSLLSEDMINSEDFVTAVLSYMSTDEVRNMLQINEWGPDTIVGE
jgi:hypothetical protein